jgi:hypothetical protein
MVTFKEIHTVAKMTEATIARIVAEQFAALMAAQNGTQTTALVNAPSKPAQKSAPQKSNDQDDDSDNETVRGVLSYVAMHGNGAQLDGETIGEKDADAEWYNAKKGKTPFAAIKLGSTVDVEYVTLTDDQGRSRNRALNVSLVKAGKSNTTPQKNPPSKPSKTERPAADMVNISGLAVRQAAPTTQNPDGCKRCGGPKHGKNGQGTILSECAQHQYITATGESFKPHKAASVLQYARWLDAHQIIVATTYDGSKAARIGGEQELNAAPQKSAPETEAAPAKRGRPAGSKNKAKAAPATSAPETTTLTGKLLRVNNARTKIQLQPKGQKFQWLDVDAGVKIKESWLEKTLLVTLDENNTVTEAGRAPKA